MILRREGNEFGAVTGRPRRCGWFDVPLLRYTAMVNGFDTLLITKLDVLDHLDEIPVCTGYRTQRPGRSPKCPPPIGSSKRSSRSTRSMPGWKTSTRGIPLRRPSGSRTDVHQFLAGSVRRRSRRRLDRPGAQRNHHSPRHPSRTTDRLSCLLSRASATVAYRRYTTASLRSFDNSRRAIFAHWLAGSSFKYVVQCRTALIGWFEP